MPSIIDFEFTGNVATTMREHVQHHNKQQLNFELNLRDHKNITNFNAESPWIYPATKSFRPEVVLNSGVTFVQGSNFDRFKNKFVDKFDEPNVNQFVNTFEKSTTVYRNAEWH